MEYTENDKHTLEATAIEKCHSYGDRHSEAYAALVMAWKQVQARIIKDNKGRTKDAINALLEAPRMEFLSQFLANQGDILSSLKPLKKCKDATWKYYEGALSAS